MQQSVDIFMTLSIALIMFGIGLELSFKNFSRVFLTKGDTYWPGLTIILIAYYFFLIDRDLFLGNRSYV